ncbi:MAG: hypothetical protein Kow0042_25820 [Calditrichia bacterium]
MQRYFFLFSSLLIILLMILHCGDTGTVESTGPTELVYAYFTNPAYNILLKETGQIQRNKIRCKLDNKLGPGIKVEVEDSVGNQLELEFRDVSNPTSREIDGRIEYFHAADKKTYASNSLSDVLAVWRDNLEMCEFMYDGPRLALRTTQNEEIFLDSLQILVMRVDD